MGIDKDILEDPTLDDMAADCPGMIPGSRAEKARKRLRMPQDELDPSLGPSEPVASLYGAERGPAKPSGETP